MRKKVRLISCLLMSVVLLGSVGCTKKEADKATEDKEVVATEQVDESKEEKKAPEYELAYLPNEYVEGAICEIVDDDVDNYIVKIARPVYATIPKETFNNMNVGDKITLEDGQVVTYKGYDGSRYMLDDPYWVEDGSSDIVTGPNHHCLLLNKADNVYLKVNKDALAEIPLTMLEAADPMSHPWKTYPLIDLLNGTSDVKAYSSGAEEEGLLKGDVYKEFGSWTDGVYTCNEQGEIISFKRYWCP